MKRLIIILALFAGLSPDAFAGMTVEECREKARNNYPLIKKYSLIEQSKDYSLSNAQKAYLPQLQVSAKVTYQSSTVEIPVKIPGLDIPALRKDQYMAVAETNQLLWNGGVIQSQKRIVEARSEVEKKQLEVELYAIEEQVNQLFFGILLFDAKLEQNQALAGELERNHVKVAGYIESGIAPAIILFFNGFPHRTITLFFGKQYVFCFSGRPNHALAMSTALSGKAFPRWNLDRENALKYLRKETLQNIPAEIPFGFVTVAYQNQPLGFVKNIGNRANNLYPQEWRIRNL